MPANAGTHAEPLCIYIDYIDYHGEPLVVMCIYIIILRSFNSCDAAGLPQVRTCLCASCCCCACAKVSTTQQKMARRSRDSFVAPLAGRHHGDKLYQRPWEGHASKASRTALGNPLLLILVRVFREQGHALLCFKFRTAVGEPQKPAKKKDTSTYGRLAVSVKSSRWPRYY